MTNERPKIEQIQYNFKTEDDLRTNKKGKRFSEDIEYNHVDRWKNPTVQVILENGAMIRWSLEDKEEEIKEEVFRADDLDSVWSSTEFAHTGIPDREKDMIENEEAWLLARNVEDCIDVYLKNETVEDVKSDWAILGDIIPEDEK